MPRYDGVFADRFLTPWNQHDVDGALALMTDYCIWEVPRGSEPHGRGAILQTIEALS
jgi:SnoaL-like domain